MWSGFGDFAWHTLVRSRTWSSLIRPRVSVRTIRARWSASRTTGHQSRSVCSNHESRLLASVRRAAAARQPSCVPRLCLSSSPPFCPGPRRALHLNLDGSRIGRLPTSEIRIGLAVLPSATGRRAVMRAGWMIDVVCKRMSRKVCWCAWLRRGPNAATRLTEHSHFRHLACRPSTSSPSHPNFATPLLWSVGPVNLNHTAHASRSHCQQPGRTKLAWRTRWVVREP